MARDRPASAYARALARLARRDHAEQEIRRLLIDEGYARDDVEQALGRLRAERLLDDAAFAARFARSRIAGRGQGRARVQQALRSRGIAREVADDGVRAALEDVSEAEALDAVARRYWQRRRNDPPLRRLRRLWAFLLQRGWPVGLVRARLTALWPERQQTLARLEAVALEAGEERAEDS